jgi:hypothetical protein
MRHLELVTCVVAGLFTRPENYVQLNRRLEHALDDTTDAKPRAGWVGPGRKSRSRPS